MYRAPNHRRVKRLAPGIGGVDDGLLLTDSRQVLATDVNREMAEPPCHLGRQLLKGMETVWP